MSFDTNEFYLKSTQEMEESFAATPEALASTLEIAERVDVSIELGKQLIPRFDCPDGKDEKAYLRELVLEGLRERYGDPPPAEAIERMEMELGVIDKMGFNAYFLIVWDFVDYAKNNGIAVGPGRGCAAGSLVAYCLRITDVDPLRYDLLFERFLNAERVSMPDIDIDFSVRGRERVIRYVTEKYGTERVAQIITFGKMFPRAATRDAARVLGHEYAIGDKLAKLIPDPQQGRPPSFEDCMQPGADLAAEVARDPVAKQIVDVAQGLEGIVRNASIHAAAVVIADRPLTDVVPLQLADAGTGENGQKIYRTVTQYSMKPIEEIGLLKMDFLGLRNLDVIEDALDIIERSAGERPNMTTLPLDDEKTYEMMARGDSVGVFQFESEGMREALRKVCPTEFEDLVALVALYRPGAMDQIPAYARGKRNPDSIQFIDDRLRPITESTKGVILYQEQAMQIAKQLGGFSGPKADDLRKAIGKKNREAMAKLKPEFFEGCKASGTAYDVIETLWATNEKSADYSLQQVPRRLLRADLLPDGVAEGQLPGRVHGRADLLGDGHQGQGPVLRQPDGGDGDRDPAAGRQRVRPRVHGRRRQHPLRPGRREGRRLRRRGGDQARPRGGGPVHVAVGLLRARGRPHGQQALDRGADQVRRLRLHRRDAPRHARGAGLRAGGRPEGPAGRADRPGLDLRPRRLRRRRTGAPPFAAPSHPPIPTHEFERPELLAMEKESIGVFITEHPLKRVREALRVKADCAIARVIDRAQGRRVGEGRRHDHRGQEDPHPQRLDDDVRDGRRPRGHGRGRRLREGAGGGRGRARRPTRSCSCAAAWTTRTPTRSASSSRTSTRFDPSEAEIEKAKAAMAERAAARRRSALRVRVDAARLQATVIDDLRELFERYPGDDDFVLEMQTRTGLRRLRSAATTGSRRATRA